MTEPSFALAYRKKLQAQELASGRRLRRDGALAREGRLPADPQSRVVHRASVLAALLLAGLVLAVFNSEALTRYARGQGETAAGRQAYALSLRWHRMMESGHATLLMDGLRESARLAREAAWPESANQVSASRVLRALGLTGAGDRAGAGSLAVGMPTASPPNGAPPREQTPASVPPDVPPQPLRRVHAQPTR